MACRQFVGVVNGEVVAHTGVLQLPLQKDAKRLHRSVVLPDYQGIGIGMNFKKAVCEILRGEGFDGRIFSTTTTPAQFHAQIKSPNWCLIRYGKAKRNSGGLREEKIANLFASSSRKRITYTFKFKGMSDG